MRRTDRTQPLMVTLSSDELPGDSVGSAGSDVLGYSREAIVRGNELASAKFVRPVEKLLWRNGWHTCRPFEPKMSLRAW